MTHCLAPFRILHRIIFRWNYINEGQLAKSTPSPGKHDLLQSAP
jgi:hypothetical protein